MNSQGNPRLLVVLPGAQGYYVDREVFRLVDGFEAFYATAVSNLGAQFHGSAHFLPLRVFRVPCHLGDVGGLLSHVIDLHTLLRALSPDVVVTFEVYSEATDQVVHAQTRREFTHVVSAYETSDFGHGVWGRLPLTRRRAERNASSPDLFIAASKKAQAALASVGVHSERTLLLRPGVFPEDFDTHPDIPKVDPPVVFYLGALNRNKGIATLVTAMQCLQASGSTRASLCIAGSGPLSGWLSGLLPARPWLRFEGRVSEERKAELLRQSTLFAYPSEETRLLGRVRWEEQGALALVEAMMAGLPVVSSDCGVLPELVSDRGCIVPQRSPARLAQSFQRLLDEPMTRQRCSETNRRFALGNLDIRQNAARFGDALESLTR